MTIIGLLRPLLCTRQAKWAPSAASKGNEAKSKMKQPSDMLTPKFEHGGSDLWSNTLPLEHGGALNSQEETAK